MPDYVLAFACKMGACRRACCVGWPIMISLEDYFHLESLECSPALRERLDRGVRVNLEPTPDRYAQICPRYDGNCHLRLEDGRCALHAEMGEEALTDVCRLYPRGVRYEDGFEISCANSCEAVPELFLHKAEPIRFIHRDMTILMPPQAKRTFSFSTMGRGQELRLWLISLVQNRTLTLPQRLILLKNRLLRAENVLEAGDGQSLNELLADETVTVQEQPKPDRAALRFGIDLAEQLLALLDEESDSIRDYGLAALNYFGKGELAYENYQTAKNHFETAFPQWETYFEHLLVNHMFFAEFPFQDRPENFTEELMALAVIYTLLRFLCIGWVAEHDFESDLIDVTAAAFRLIDHTDFERRAVHLLKILHSDDLSRLDQWIIL